MSPAVALVGAFPAALILLIAMLLPSVHAVAASLAPLPTTLAGLTVVTRTLNRFRPTTRRRRRLMDIRGTARNLRSPTLT